MCNLVNLVNCAQQKDGACVEILFFISIRLLHKVILEHFISNEHFSTRCFTQAVNALLILKLCCKNLLILLLQWY